MANDFHNKFEQVGGMRMNKKKTGWNLDVTIPPQRAGEKIQLFCFKAWAQWTETPYDFDVYIKRLKPIPEPTEEELRNPTCPF